MNGATIDPAGRFVLYWMTAARRTSSNHALDRAVELAIALDRPLVVLEALRCDYPWASDRHHSFLVQGMRDNNLEFARAGVLHYPYVENERSAGRGLLAALGRLASVVVTDDFPASFLPRMQESASRQVPVRLEAIDSNGLLPLRATEKVYTRAYDLRRFMQRELPAHLEHAPRLQPLEKSKLRSLRRLPSSITRRWPSAPKELLFGEPGGLAALPIDHEVAQVEREGGARRGGEVLERFLDERLCRYDRDGRHPDLHGTSGLSAYLHFGHVSVHEIVRRVLERSPATPATSPDPRQLAKSPWGGLDPQREAFLDQLVVWRELSYQFAAKRPDHADYESLPNWARETLDAHTADERPHLYELEEFENAQTHDELWNAAQNQLRFDGVIHNYLRMLWGKKILHWSESPRRALQIMTQLNDKYALDGRDPNSVSGIFWVLGRHDRAWGPEREVFGKIRYMSSANTRRKLRLREYEAFWSGVEKVR